MFFAFHLLIFGSVPGQTLFSLGPPLTPLIDLAPLAPQLYQTREKCIRLIPPLRCPLLQLRVIRAFKSTLEDMEEKRSIHSLRCQSGSRLPRPMSDMSYIDEDGGGNGVATATAAACATAGVPISQGLRAATSSNGGGRTHLTVQSSRKTNLASCTTTASSAVTDTYIKVEGQAYRVPQRSSGASQQQRSSQSQQQQQQQQTAARVRRCSDAQTQSAESSFANEQSTNTTNTNYCDGLANYNHHGYYPPPSPSPYSLDMASAPAKPSVQVGVPSRGPSPVLLAPAVAAPQPTSPLLTYSGYDPSYCQYLGQAADGYQYELVRRPSIGPPELTIPAAAYAAAQQQQVQQQQQQYLRRPSTGASPYPQAHSPAPPMYSTPPQYAYAQNSLQGSFDSCAGPPVTPIFIQNSSSSVSSAATLQQPLSPRHLHHHGAASSFVAHTGRKSEQQAQQQQAQIPKLIHETSI